MRAPNQARSAQRAARREGRVEEMRERTLGAIGEALGLSRERVRQVQHVALLKMYDRCRRLYGMEPREVLLALARLALESGEQGPDAAGVERGAHYPELRIVS